MQPARAVRRSSRCSSSSDSWASIERQVELVAEVQPVAAAGPQEIQDLVPRHAAGPVDEAPRVVELVELVPEDQARLLEQVVGVVQVADERVNIAEELRLMLPQERGVRPPAAPPWRGASRLVPRTWGPRFRSGESSVRSPHAGAAPESIHEPVRRIEMRARTVARCGANRQRIVTGITSIPPRLPFCNPVEEGRVRTLRRLKKGTLSIF